MHKVHRILDKTPALLFSLRILFKNPLLFLPKLLVAVLYGFSVLLSMDLVKKIFPLLSLQPVSSAKTEFFSLFGDIFLVFFISAVAFFLDIVFCGLYPVLVEQAIKGKISLKFAFAKVRKKLMLILFSGIFSWLIVGFVSLVLFGILLFFKLDSVSWAISFIVAFGFIFFFYFLFPTVVFKDDDVGSSFRDAVKESFSNGRIVFVYSLIPFSLSVIKFVLAFYSSDYTALVVYWVLVFVTAFIYSIHAVITQVLFSRLYLHKSKSLSGVKSA